MGNTCAQLERPDEVETVLHPNIIHSILDEYTELDSMTVETVVRYVALPCYENHRISLLIAILILSCTTSTTNYPQHAHCPCLDQSARNQWLRIYAFKVRGFKRLGRGGLDEEAVKSWKVALDEGVRGGGVFGMGRKCERLPKVGEVQALLFPSHHRYKSLSPYSRPPNYSSPQSSHHEKPPHSRTSSPSPSLTVTQAGLDNEDDDNEEDTSDDGEPEGSKQHNKNGLPTIPDDFFLEDVRGVDSGKVQDQVEDDQTPERGTKRANSEMDSEIIYLGSTFPLKRARHAGEEPPIGNGKNAAKIAAIEKRISNLEEQRTCLEEEDQLDREQGPKKVQEMSMLDGKLESLVVKTNAFVNGLKKSIEKATLHVDQEEEEEDDYDRYDFDFATRKTQEALRGHKDQAAEIMQELKEHHAEFKNTLMSEYQRHAYAQPGRSQRT